MSSSQPLARETEVLSSAIKRGKTDPTNSESFDTLPRLRDGVYKELCRRLQAQGVRDELSQALFHWCLPTKLEHEALWKQLLGDPLSVPTRAINTLLELEPSSLDDPNERSLNLTYYYMRSFRIKVSDCRLVISRILSSGHDGNKKAFHYLVHMKGMDSNADITLRYLGKTNDRPWNRHASDLRSTFLSGFLPYFFKAVAHYAEAVITKATVHVAVGATTDRTYTVPDLVGLQEKILIALFGRTALNTQAGGDETMRFYDEDHSVFLILETDTITKLRQTMQPCSMEVRIGVAQYAKDIREYINGHSSTVKASRRKRRLTFSDMIENNLAQQAVPRTVSDGSALMVTVGSDIGETHSNQVANFSRPKDLELPPS
ncbi:hypothetical protein E8E13_001606 [Curvularia kusanoi]|uniref:Uncharacterized protein n=1 Tax=Curvularia kusanoi TaxID=90978 RepID=A0A9P4TEP0_CURKU|nr:hypothetical protein E8E13_001606 [Curvularia kusanoi]